MTFSEIFISKKIEDIKKYLDETRDIFNFSDEEILNDTNKLHSSERLLQLIVDTILDINYHFIKELDLKSADDLQSTFYILSDNNVLPSEFAQKIAPVVGLRNRIVHRYDDINKKLFLEIFRKNISDFEIYIEYTVKYLSSKGKKVVEDKK